MTEEVEGWSNDEAKLLGNMEFFETLVMLEGVSIDGDIHFEDFDRGTHSVGLPRHVRHSFPSGVPVGSCSSAEWCWQLRKWMSEVWRCACLLMIWLARLCRRSGSAALWGVRGSEHIGALAEGP
jgi:hypothetical protein